VVRTFPLTKYHGLGNDFLVLFADAVDAGGPKVDGDLARRVCDRHRGIGADGLLVASEPSDVERTAGIDVVMALMNADGSPAEMSGNGIRCLGHAVARSRGLREGPLVVATDAGRRDLWIRPGSHPGETLVRVGMGEVRPGPAIPAAVTEHLDGRRHATADLGNPHLVVEVTSPFEVDLLVEGRGLEEHFADGINVEFIASTPDGLDLAVWERGAGITEACGTGACAATAIAAGWGLVGDSAHVRMPGGSAEVLLDEAEVVLIGPSELIAEIEVPW